MSRTVPTIRVALAAFAVLLASCGGQKTADKPPDVYTIRGEISRLPAPGRSPRELWIHHEAVPSFKDTEGEVVGMEAMTMPFPLAEAVSVEGLAVGDRVEFVLEVRWEGTPPIVVSKVGKVAEDEAAPPSSE